MIGVQDLQIVACEGDYLIFHNASYQEAVNRVINVHLWNVPDPSRYHLYCYKDRIEFFEDGAAAGISYEFSPDEYDPDDEKAEDFGLGVIYYEQYNI